MLHTSGYLNNICLHCSFNWNLKRRKLIVVSTLYSKCSKSTFTPRKNITCHCANHCVIFSAWNTLYSRRKINQTFDQYWWIFKSNWRVSIAKLTTSVTAYAIKIIIVRDESWMFTAAGNFSDCYSICAKLWIWLQGLSTTPN